MTTERKGGYYWVRHWQFHGWHIGEKTVGGGWLLTGMAMPYDDDDMEEIGDRIPAPGEGWRCVPTEATEDMLDEVCSAEGIRPWVPETMAGTYRAMVDAAPKP